MKTNITILKLIQANGHLATALESLENKNPNMSQEQKKNCLIKLNEIKKALETITLKNEGTKNNEK